MVNSTGSGDIESNPEDFTEVAILQGVSATSVVQAILDPEDGEVSVTVM